MPRDRDNRKQNWITRLRSLRISISCYDHRAAPVRSASPGISRPDRDFRITIIDYVTVPGREMNLTPVRFSRYLSHEGARRRLRCLPRRTIYAPVIESFSEEDFWRK